MQFRFQTKQLLTLHQSLSSFAAPPQILHSNQGQNFESTILVQTLSAFGICKSCTTPHHPQEDGMVEHFNRV